MSRDKGGRIVENDEYGSLDEWTWTAWVQVGGTSWRSLGETFWRVPQEIRQQRNRTCQACELYTKASSQCRACGCPMAYKTWYGSFACPMGKWGKFDPPDPDQQSPG